MPGSLPNKRLKLRPLLSDGHLALRRCREDFCWPAGRALLMSFAHSTSLMLQNLRILGQFVGRGRPTGYTVRKSALGRTRPNVGDFSGPMTLDPQDSRFSGENAPPEAG